MKITKIEYAVMRSDFNNDIAGMNTTEEVKRFENVNDAIAHYVELNLNEPDSDLSYFVQVYWQ